MLAQRNGFAQLQRGRPSNSVLHLADGAPKRSARPPRGPAPAPALVADLSVSLESVASLSGPLKPLLVTIARDIASPTVAGVARLGALYYALLARPSPLAGLYDHLTSREEQPSTLTQRQFVTRERLGGGNFGVTFEGLQLEATDPRPGTGAVSVRAPLNVEQKKRRVVLKRVNQDKSYVRGDFLKGGTMAMGATEVGAVESYMNAKIKRNPAVSRSCAQYLGTFIAERQEGAFTPGSQWLVWRFESDATLADALDGRLGGAFPTCLEQVVLGARASTNASQDKRDALVVKSVMRQVLTGLARLHSIGIVHRDIKPDNLLITAEGQVKMIDFGAAADMCTGVNFNPLYGMLDPRYSPPEELVMPRDFPRLSPVLSALLSPLVWVWGCPDLFDSYSCGVLLVQMCVPELRSSTNIHLFNAEMRQCGYNLEMWRSYRGYRCNLALLDRNKGAGWDLAKKLLCPRDQLNRGRLSVGQALAHRFFLPEF